MPATSTKFSVVDRDRIRRELEKKYPGPYITPSKLPAESPHCVWASSNEDLGMVPVEEDVK